MRGRRQRQPYYSTVQYGTTGRPFGIRRVRRRHRTFLTAATTVQYRYYGRTQESQQRILSSSQPLQQPAPKVQTRHCINMAPKLTFDNIGEFSAARANELFESHKKYLEWRKSEWASRGPDALQKRLATRAATHKSWRQMKGMDLVRHEMNHPGNKPFVIGMG